MEQKPVSNSENQETSGNSVSPFGMEEYLKIKEQFEKTTGMTIEQFYEMKRKIEEQKKQQLQLQLKEIETEIATLQVKRQEILKQLGTGITRIRKSNNRETDNIAFKYEGQILPANQIAKLLGLDSYYSNNVNWKDKFKSVLINGNSGGRNPEVSEKIRKYVEVVYL